MNPVPIIKTTHVLSVVEYSLLSVYSSEHGFRIDLVFFLFTVQNMALGLTLSSFCLQFGAWLCWICWLVLSILSLIKVYHYHKKEAFLSSMNRERQRLLQRVGHTEPMVLWSSLRPWPLDRSGGLKVPPSLLKGRTWLHTNWPHP